MKYYKTVLMPIEVAAGNYCWGEGRICEHFDNEDGRPSCELKFGGLTYDNKGNVPKPLGCLKLKEEN